MDRRDMDHRWYYGFNQDNMTIAVEVDWDFEGADEDFEGADESGVVHIPAKYEVCPTCEGKGKHVHPGVDSHGLTAEDFAEDPDLVENYISGMYDVPCAECRGERVVPVVDETRATPAQIKLVEEIQESFYEDQRCRAMESGHGW